MATPAEGLARLRAAAAAGELDRLCRRHRIRVLTVFGSAAGGDPGARDLDVGVLLEPGATADHLPLIRDLELLTAADVDVVVLNGAGAVLRERALVGSVVLDESESGAWAAPPPRPCSSAWTPSGCAGWTSTCCPTGDPPAPRPGGPRRGPRRLTAGRATELSGPGDTVAA